MAVGSLHYGTGPYGTGDGFTLVFEKCIVRGANEIWVQVEALSNVSKVNANSELNPKNWNLQSLSIGAFPRLIQSIEAVADEKDAQQAGAQILYDYGMVPALRVFTDGPLSPREIYLLTYNGFGAEGCEITSVLVEPSAIEHGLADDYGTIEDYKNPQIERDKLPLGKLGSYNISDDGDIAIDNGEASLRKRILRRITTSVAAFYHLPNYGTDLENKSTISPDLARRIQERIKSGVRSEPDVLSAVVKVYAVRNEPGMIVIQASALSRFGGSVTVSEKVNIAAI